MKLIKTAMAWLKNYKATLTSIRWVQIGTKQKEHVKMAQSELKVIKMH